MNLNSFKSILVCFVLSLSSFEINVEGRHKSKAYNIYFNNSEDTDLPDLYTKCKPDLPERDLVSLYGYTEAEAQQLFQQFRLINYNRGICECECPTDLECVNYGEKVGRFCECVKPDDKCVCVANQNIYKRWYKEGSVCKLNDGEFCEKKEDVEDYNKCRKEYKCAEIKNSPTHGFCRWKSDAVNITFSTLLLQSVLWVYLFTY